MAGRSDVALRFNRPGVFKPAFVRRALDAGAPITRQSLADFDDTNVLSTSSFRYDPVGVGVKSTQQLNVDYSLFANHTFFNSAEVKVNVAFEEVFNRYPFDGSRREVEQFFDGLTGFEKWVFDAFPKNVGYLKFEGGSFVSVVDHAGSQFPTISRNQSGRSILDPGLDSVTFELHIHVPPVANENQVVLQKLSGSVHGFTLGLLGTTSTDDVDVFLSFVSASNALTLTGSIPKGDAFTHLVATYDRRSDVGKLFLYADEELVASSSNALSMGQVDFALAPMYIGSGSQVVTGSAGAAFKPVETLSGALDELRVFHDVRNVRLQQRFAKRNVFADPTLKLYFKFNEPTGTLGASTSDSINRVVVDSSGNSLTSFIDESTFDFSLRSTGTIASPMTYEEGTYNPVLFSTYPGVVALNRELLASGSAYDAANPNTITKLVPQHYFLEGQSFEALSDVTGTVGDELTGTGMPGAAELGQPQLLAALMYVVAKELDEVKLFVDQFGNSLFVDYDDFDTTPDQLLTLLASYRGFELPGLFNNATFEQFVNAYDIDDEFSTSALSLQSVQNQLWRRLLSNLNEVVKSKGTVHSIKAFVRTLGIDPDQNFRIREFGGPKQGRIGQSRESKSTVSTMLDLTSGASLTSSFLTASTHAEPGYPLRSDLGSRDLLLTSGSWTYEGTYRFPRGQANVASQSLVRMCVTGSAAPAVVFNLLAVSGSDEVSSSLRLLGKPASGSTGNSLELVLSGFNVMDGRSWHMSFGRHRNDDPLAELESDVTSSYFLRAYHQDGGEVIVEETTSSFFMESAANNHLLDAQQNEPMRLAFGAQTVEAGGYLASTGGTTTALAARMGHVRFWSKGLLEDESREHARNFKSLGVVDPRVNFNFVDELTGSWQRLRMDASTDQPTTSSDAGGRVDVFDFSQNALHLAGWGFAATSSVILPEAVMYSIVSPKFDEAIAVNKVRVRSFKDIENVERYGGVVAPVFETPAHEVPEDDPRFSIDFSIADALNEDIVNIFVTLDAMDDALGEPGASFDDDYPRLEGLRDVYFNRLTAQVNLKSFFEFFRWFDASVGMFIEQLIPRKTRFLGTSFVVESHMLERAKFQHKYEDVYIIEDDRSASKGTIVLQQVVGRVKRY